MESKLTLPSYSSTSFAKETVLKMKSTVTRHQKLTVINWQPSLILLLILLQLQKKLPKNSTLTSLWSFGVWSKLERWKGLISGCLISWLEIKKVFILKCCLLLFYTTVNHFSIRLWHTTKNALYVTTAMASSVARPRRSSKALPKAKLAPKKKVMVTVW